MTLSHLSKMKLITDMSSRGYINVPYLGPAPTVRTKKLFEVVAPPGENIIIDEASLLFTSPVGTSANDLSVQLDFSNKGNKNTHLSGPISDIFDSGMVDHAITDRWYCYCYDIMNNVYGIRWRAQSVLNLPVDRFEIYVLHTHPFSYQYKWSYYTGKLGV